MKKNLDTQFRRHTSICNSLINYTPTLGVFWVDFKTNTEYIKLQPTEALSPQPQSTLVMGTLKNRGFARYLRIPAIDGVIYRRYGPMHDRKPSIMAEKRFRTASTR